MEAEVELCSEDIKFYDDVKKYKRMIENLFISWLLDHRFFLVGLLSQFIDKPSEIYWKAVLRIFAYIISSLGKESLYKKYSHIHILLYSNTGYVGHRGDRKFTTSYLIFVSGNLVIWWSEKQDVLSRSSVEAEYRNVAHTICKLLWLNNFLTRLGFEQKSFHVHALW